MAAPLVRCQDDDDIEEEDFVDAEETVVDEPAAAATAGGSAGGYADMATEYLNTATELGKQYASQAAEVAQQYLGSYGVSSWREFAAWRRFCLGGVKRKRADQPMQQLLSVSKGAS